MSYLVKGNYFDTVYSQVKQIIDRKFGGNIENFLDYCNSGWREYVDFSVPYETDGQAVADMITNYLIADSNFIEDTDCSSEQEAMEALAEDPYAAVDALSNPAPGDDTEDMWSEESLVSYLSSSSFYFIMDRVARIGAIPKVSYGLLVEYGII